MKPLFPTNVKRFSNGHIQRTNRVLGVGSFGVVILGKLHGANVALKTIKHDTRPVWTQNDVAILSKLRHINVVSLIGVLMEKSEGCDEKELSLKLKEGFSIILEYAPLGTVYSYITKNKAKEKTLVTIAVGVASGMTYLHDQGVIHRDLACRNILLDNHIVAKICDFGMSTQVQHSSNWRQEYYYSNDEINAIPVLWSPRESIVGLMPDQEGQGLYSRYTDVWSFGVVLWEMWSGGKTPYQCDSKKVDVKTVIKLIWEGTNPHCNQPVKGHPEFINVMLKCFSTLPQERGKFSGIRAELDRIYEKHFVTSTSFKPASNDQRNDPQLIFKTVVDLEIWKRKENPGAVSLPQLSAFLMSLEGFRASDVLSSLCVQLGLSSCAEARFAIRRSKDASIQPELCLRKILLLWIHKDRKGAQLGRLKEAFSNLSHRNWADQLSSELGADNIPVHLAVSKQCGPQIMIDVPLPPTNFVGREMELNRLLSLYSSLVSGELVTSPLVAITGKSGIGKSTLVQQFCHHIAKNEKYGLPSIVLIRCQTEQLTKESLRNLFRQTGLMLAGKDFVNPIHGFAHIHLGQKERKMILILHDIAPANSLAQALVDFVISSCVPAILVLATTTFNGLLEASERIEVPPLSKDASERFVSSSTAHKLSKEEASELCKRLRYIPSDLKIAVSQINNHGFSAFQRRGSYEKQNDGGRDGLVISLNTMLSNPSDGGNIAWLLKLLCYTSHTSSEIDVEDIFPLYLVTRGIPLESNSRLLVQRYLETLAWHGILSKETSSSGDILVKPLCGNTKYSLSATTCKNVKGIMKWNNPSAWRQQFRSGAEGRFWCCRQQIRRRVVNVIAALDNPTLHDILPVANTKRQKCTFIVTAIFLMLSIIYLPTSESCNITVVDKNSLQSDLASWLGLFPQIVQSSGYPNTRIPEHVLPFVACLCFFVITLEHFIIELILRGPKWTRCLHSPIVFRYFPWMLYVTVLVLPVVAALVLSFWLNVDEDFHKQMIYVKNVYQENSGSALVFLLLRAMLFLLDKWSLLKHFFPEVNLPFLFSQRTFSLDLQKQ